MTIPLAVPAPLVEALTVLVVAATMLVGFVLINFGLWLPSVLEWLHGHRTGPDGNCGPESIARPFADPAPDCPRQHATEEWGSMMRQG